jgi:hypothetical protein
MTFIQSLHVFRRNLSFVGQLLFFIYSIPFFLMKIIFAHSEIESTYSLLRHLEVKCVKPCNTKKITGINFIENFNKL